MYVATRRGERSNMHSRFIFFEPKSTNHTNEGIVPHRFRSAARTGGELRPMILNSSTLPLSFVFLCVS
jgi:hypothetical protein